MPTLKGSLTQALVKPGAIHGVAFGNLPSNTPITATDATFFTKDGVSTTAQLAYKGQAVKSATVSAMYQFDWQGRQLLYPTPRTNAVKYSQDLTNAAWTKSGAGVAVAPVVTQNYGIAPDGTQTTTRVQLNLNGGTTSGDRSLVFEASPTSMVVGTEYTYSVWMRAASGTTPTVQLSANGLGTELCTLGPTMTRYTFTITADATRPLVIGLRGASGTSNTADIEVWGAQREAASSVTPYIPTTSAPVTVTDYTLSVSDLVTFGQAGTANAPISWTGTGTIA